MCIFLLKTLNQIFHLNNLEMLQIIHLNNLEMLQIFHLNNLEKPSWWLRLTKWRDMCSPEVTRLHSVTSGKCLAMSAALFITYDHRILVVDYISSRPTSSPENGFIYISSIDYVAILLPSIWKCLKCHSVSSGFSTIFCCHIHVHVLNGNTLLCGLNRAAQTGVLWGLLLHRLNLLTK